MSTTEAPLEYDQDEIGTSVQWDLGHYPSKLLDVQVVDNKMGVSLLAIFQVLEGPKQGEDLRIYRSLKPYQKQDGNWWVPGLREIKADLQSVDGLPAGEKMTREPSQARVQYAKGLAHKHVDVLVYDEEYTDKKTGEKKTTRKKRIVGFSGSGPAHADLGLA